MSACRCSGAVAEVFVCLLLPKKRISGRIPAVTEYYTQDSNSRLEKTRGDVLERWKSIFPGVPGKMRGDRRAGSSS